MLTQTLSLCKPEHSTRLEVEEISGEADMVQVIIL